MKVLTMKVPTIKEIRERSAAKRYGYEYVLDSLANYVVKAAIVLRIRPTELTMVWVIAQFFTPFLFLFGDYFSFVLGIVLFQAMFIVDLSDGKLYRFIVAKKPRLKPLFPKYIDRLGHFINNSFLFVLLGIGTSFRFGEMYVVIGIIAAFLYLLNKATSVNPAWYKSAEERETVAAVMVKTAPRSGASAMKQFMFDVVRIEHLGNILFFGILLDIPHYTLWFYAFLHAIEFVRKLYAQGKLLLQEDAVRK